MKSIFKNIRFYCSLMLLLVVIYMLFRLLPFSVENQRFKVDQAEINNIRYGLLNADEWKEHLASIISTKIEEFELTESNRETLKAEVEQLLYKLLDEVNLILQDDMGRIKRFLMNTFVDLDKLRANVPELAETLLEEMAKPENKENLKFYLLGKLEGFVSGTFNSDEQIDLNNLLDKYGFENKETGSLKLEQVIGESDNELMISVLVVFILLGFLFVINYFGAKPVHISRPAFILASALIFLICGISIPMINIEALITRLDFQLMGENIVFENQLLFFQSKSILDVVWILVQTLKPEMILVGILIMSFSVLFPVTKIICTFLNMYFPGRFASSKFIMFFTYKSGKWSMADVFVVAIFMAFIGFNGIISDQLSHLSSVSENVEILTTNGTSLQPGFYFFLAFCLVGLFLSELLQKRRT